MNDYFGLLYVYTELFLLLILYSVYYTVTLYELKRSVFYLEGMYYHRPLHVSEV